jgi:hypothetical protein
MAICLLFHFFGCLTGIFVFVSLDAGEGYSLQQVFCGVMKYLKAIGQSTRPRPSRD